MGLLANETITITRKKATGSYVSGFYVAGASSSSSISVNVQPLSGKEIMQLPEADRNKEVLLVLTESEIMVNDIVTRGGKTYEIQRIEDFSNQPSPHYEGTALLIEGQ